MQQQSRALADPSRFRLFQFMYTEDRPVLVAELTALMGFNHNAIRQHLAILVDAGLVAETDELRTVRGRPRKQYTAREDALHAFRSISGSYEQLASMLIDVAAGEAPYAVGYRAAGRTCGPSQARPAAIHHLVSKLATEGFEPVKDGEDHIVMQRCPYADVAARNPAIVCELHRGLINGHLAAADPALTADLRPQEPHQASCRITIRESSGTTS